VDAKDQAELKERVAGRDQGGESAPLHRPEAVERQ
jgi:hypothetical protein